MTLPRIVSSSGNPNSSPQSPGLDRHVPFEVFHRFSGQTRLSNRAKHADAARLAAMLARTCLLGEQGVL